MPTVIKGQPTSKEVIARLKEEGRPVLLSFSCGKDSIAAWIALEEAGVEVVPVYMYTVPNLKFVNDELEYFERVFGVRIHRYPHVSAFGFLSRYTFSSPEHDAVLDAVGSFPEPSYSEHWDYIREELGLPADTWVADGVRAADSIVRRASFVKYGVMKRSSHKVSVVADWLKGEVMEAIERRGVELPIDYKIFGRSFDGLDARFTKPMREHLPEDYKTLRDWFPMIEADLARHDLYGF